MEQAKRLKELGVEQKSTQWYADVNYDHPPRANNREDFAAFDTDELLAMLPDDFYLVKGGRSSYYAKHSDNYYMDTAIFDSPSHALAALIIDGFEKWDGFSLPEINELIKQYHEK